MGRPLMIQEADHARIERLKARLGITHKIDVVRAGVDLLEAQATRQERIARWTRAAARVAAESQRVNAEFRRHSRLKQS
jgi:aminoglycoside phosphotransferase (APT) family kinase protein